MSAKESRGNPNRQTLEEIVSGKKEEPSSSDDDPDPADWVKTSYTYDVTAAYYEVLTETTNGVTTAYDYGIERLSAYSGSSAWNTIKTQYVYDGRGSVAQELSNNNSWYTFGGALSKTAKTSYSYTPFGELLGNESSGFRFNHEYYDAATGMLNLRARQYEPAIVRFNQRDIWRGKIEMPVSQNRYLYCVNDPIGYYDRSGNRVDEDAGKPKKVKPSTNVKTVVPFSEDTAQSLRQEQFAIRKINSANRQLDATLRSVGIDTNHSGDATNQAIAKARKDIAKKVADGTLSDWDQANIIATTCEAAKKLEVREQLLNPEYWVRSFDIARKGDYAEDFTGAGLAMQVGLGLIPGVGQAADIRDFIYAVSHTKDNSFWANAGLIGLSLIALIPVVGDIGKGLKGLKYLKHADEAADVLDAVGDVAKHGDELADAAKQAGKTGELSPDFYVKPNGEVIPATGYRYIPSDASYLDELATTMEIPAKPSGTYFSFDKFDTPSPGKLQVPHDASIRGSFDTLQIADDIRIPFGNWGEASWLEPITKDFPEYGIGGATQAITSQKITLSDLIDLTK